VQPLAASLRRHRQPRRAALKPDLVRDYSLQRRHVPRPACNLVPVHIEPDGQIVVRPPQPPIEQHPLRRKNR